MELVVHDLGKMAYAPALAIQQELVQQVQLAPSVTAHLLLVEHNPPVITTGRRACDEQLLIRPEHLARMGIELHHTSRGGTITYHGPGQLVAYPILALAAANLTVRQYVHGLEEALIQLLGRFGLAGSRIDGMTGVWVNGEKIAAIGVAVSKWVTYHGLALNVSTNLDHFNFIVPCGLAGKRVTSLSKCLGRDVSVAEVKGAMAECLASAVGLDIAPVVLSRNDDCAPSACKYARPTRANGEIDTPVSLSLSASVSPVLQGPVPPGRRFPPWLRMTLPTGPAAASVQQLLQEMGLSTVCQAARCPNIGECFSRRTATFMILGDVCTRACRFCAVGSGTPLPQREDEPSAIALACQRLGLKHVVITSVTRDDLPDGGASQFARTITEVRRLLPHATIEVLTPDFLGRHVDVNIVLAAGPDVFNHNLETVLRLAPYIRPQASYQRSLDVLRYAKANAAQPGRDRLIAIKSGLMVGLGETTGEILSAMRDLRAAGCDMLTIGQYLAPSPGHAPIARFVEPAEFDAIAAAGREMGFAAVAAAPLVRSSYHADGMFTESRSAKSEGA